MCISRVRTSMGQIVPCFLPSTRLQEPADLRDFHFTHDSVCTTSSRGCVSTRLHGKHRRRGSCVHGAPRQHYEQHGAARISAPGHASVSRQDTRDIRRLADIPPHVRVKTEGDTCHVLEITDVFLHDIASTDEISVSVSDTHHWSKLLHHSPHQ